MQNSWATKRKLSYATVVLGVLGILLAGYVAWKLYKPPTCFDRTQNQDEVGIDCGGVCDLRCDSQISPMTQQWTRAFEVSEGFYSVLAYVENPNLSAYTDKASYHFLLYDANNTLVFERKGETFINGDDIVPIFEGSINTGNKEARRAFFEFIDPPAVWYRLEDEHTVEIVRQAVVRTQPSPRIEATIRNKEVYELRDLEVGIIVFDTAGNALAVSETVVPILLPQSEQIVRFTWPQPFDGVVGRLEIIPRIPRQEEF